MIPTLNVGDVIKVAEADYCYRLGELYLRLTKIGTTHRQADGQWVSLEGIELRSDGSIFRPDSRPALVRVHGVRKQA
jgi:hypothetical protein